MLARSLASGGVMDEKLPERLGFSRPEDSLGWRLWHVLHAYQRTVEQALVDLDLTHLQYMLLTLSGYLALTGEVPSQTRLAAVAGLDKMMVSKVVRLLEEKGYVARSPHPDDPRANRVDVTPDGLDVLRKAMPLVRTLHDGFFDCLGERKMVLVGLIEELMAARVIR
jgi:DNA-binding MarR family transcriptional regulator